MYIARMVVGSKAEDELLSMTRKEELLKMPAHKRFREFNTLVGWGGRGGRV